MLGITSTQPVHWPPSASPAIAPVTPVGPVAPAQGASHDNASGFGSGRQGRAGGAPDTAQDRSASADKAQTEPKAAPLLPREPAEGRQPEGASTTGEAELSEEQKREAQAEEKARQALPLKEVLSNIWKASAAVVEVALGREAGAVGSANTGSDARTVDAAVSNVSAGRTVDAGAAALDRSLVPQPAADPVTYSDQGLGLWESVETGGRVNEKA